MKNIMKKKEANVKFEDDLQLFQLIEFMIKKFEDEKAEQILTPAHNMRIAYNIKDMDYTFTITIKDKVITVVPIKIEDAEVELTTTSNDFHKMYSNQLDTILALVTKRVTIDKGSLDKVSLAGMLPIAEYYIRACNEFSIEI